MMSRQSELLTVGLGRVLGAAVTLVGFAALTRLLPPEEYALVALLTAFSSFAGLALINPGGQWANRHVHEWHDGKMLPARLRELLHLVLAAAVLMGCLAAGWHLLAQEAGLVGAMSVGVAMAAWIHFTTAATTLAATLNALGHRTASVVWQLATTGLGLLFAALFVYLKASAIPWLAGLAAGAVLAYLGARSTMRRLLAEEGYPEAIRRQHRPFFQEDAFKRFALGLTVVTTLMWLEGNGYRFILERGWSARDLGLFLMALSVPAQLTAVLESVVMQFTYPYFYRSLAGLGDRQGIASRTSAMSGALLPLYWVWGGLLFVLAPQFLYLVAGADYHPAGQWMMFGVMLEVARLTGNVWQLAAQAKKDFRPMVAPFAVGAAGSLVTAFLVVAFNGPVAALGAGLVTAAISKTALLAMRARRMLPIRVPAARAAAAGLVLVVGLAAHSLLSRNHGAWVSLSLLMGAGAVFAALAYLHLRSAKGFRALLQQRLG